MFWGLNLSMPILIYNNGECLGGKQVEGDCFQSHHPGVSIKLNTDVTCN